MRESMSTPRASSLSYNPNLNPNKNGQGGIEDYYHVTKLDENVN